MSKQPKTVPVGTINGKAVFLVLHVCDALGQPVYEGDRIRMIDNPDYQATVGNFRRTAVDPHGVLTTIYSDREGSWTGSGNMQQSGWIRVDTPMTTLNRLRIGYNRFKSWARFTRRLPAKQWRSLYLFSSKYWSGAQRQPIYNNHVDFLRKELGWDFRALKKRLTDRFRRLARA